jgi:hypothetical protein
LQLTLRSSTQKYGPEYKLKVTYSAPSTGKNWEDKEVTGKFTQWFNSHGYLQHKEFQQWLNSNIDVLKTAQAELSKKEKTSERIPVLMPATQADAISTSATGVETASPVSASAKKSRPKKKA